ncbi:MAG: Pr6Pr family membrane protein [Actinomycetota bacterium]|nr:Pr6Pr family membrane protein [Actinomycetota bacterium]
MREPSTARRPAIGWNLFIVLVIVAALGTQLVLVIRGTHVLTEGAGLPPISTRIIRFFSYFTVDSNILCAITAATLVANPDRDGRIWRVLRLNALVGITVTGLIYVTLLRPVVNLSGLPKLTDIGMHYVVPLAMVIGWLLFGPRPRIDTATLLPSLIYPAAYIGYTIAHGAASHWYPYPFTDVTTLGYPVTIRNGVGVCVLLLGVSALFMYADGWLINRWPARSDAARER